MRINHTAPLLALLLAAAMVSFCQMIDRKSNAPAKQAAIEDAQNVILTTGNALRFYYEDYKSYPDTFETLRDSGVSLY